jgi:hypothetical protein
MSQSTAGKTRARTHRALLKRAESYLDVDTTIDHADGTTDAGSGAHHNQDVPGQTARDAGKTRANPSVSADRLPGELPDGVESPKPQTESTMSQLNERASTVGLFPGCTVKVMETASKKVVERHAIVTRVSGKEITVSGGETYSQDRYTFLRMA